MTEKLVLLDGGYFVSRMAKHWAPKGRFTRWMRKVERKSMNYAHFLNKVRRTVFQDLNYIQMRINQAGYGKCDVQVCWDGSNGRNHRGKLYSNYKANRVPKTLLDTYNAEDYTNRDIREDYNSLNLDAMKLRKNFVGHYCQSKEADDLIADFVADNLDKDIIIFTQDSDLHQLLAIHPTLKFHNFTTALEPIINFNFNLYSDWKAMAGDASDNIPGVPNLGPKKATELIIKFGQLENMPLEVFNTYRMALGFKNHAAEVLKTFRDDNDKSEGWAKRKYGVVWSQIENRDSFNLNENQYQKLIAADIVDEVWFIQDSYFDTIKDYREIIALPSRLYVRKSKD
jgi:5'-3' exonuclease